jgi:hypothetical protein
LPRRRARRSAPAPPPPLGTTVAGANLASDLIKINVTSWMEGAKTTVSDQLKTPNMTEWLDATKTSLRASVMAALKPNLTEILAKPVLNLTKPTIPLDQLKAKPTLCGFGKKPVRSPAAERGRGEGRVGGPSSWATGVDG